MYTLALVVTLAVAFLGYRRFTRPPLVATVTAKTEDVARVLALTGHVEPARRVVISPQFSGRLTEFVHREGESVKAGEVLARLDDTSTTAAVLQQQASLSSRLGDLDQAKRELARTEGLVARGAIPPVELEQAKLAVSRATDDVSRLGAALHDGRSRLVLVAPFDGTLLRREGEIGQVVGPQTAVFELASVEGVRVSAEVDERYVRVIRPGMRAEVLALGAENQKQAAKISYIAQAIDPQTGAATIRLAYEVPPTTFLAGASVDINIDVSTIPGAVVLPRESVGGAGNETYVLVLNGENVERRPVVIDEWPSPLVVVRTGLRAGEQVTVDPKVAKEGARVRRAEGP
jgi:RND family efflux transporter MFP subunit